MLSPEIERCNAEMRHCSRLLAEGHPERVGLHAALFDWMAESILLGDGDQGVEQASAT